MRNYEAPVVELVRLTCEDVITTSINTPEIPFGSEADQF